MLTAALAAIFNEPGTDLDQLLERAHRVANLGLAPEVSLRFAAELPAECDDQAPEPAPVCSGCLICDFRLWQTRRGDRS